MKRSCSSMKVEFARYAIFCSMDYRERGSHARGVYPHQDTSSKGTARIKQVKDANKE